VKAAPYGFWCAAQITFSAWQTIGQRGLKRANSVRPEDRAKAIALYSTINAVGWSIGALLGSWLVEHLPANIEWAGMILQPASNLPFVFFLSGVLRLVVSSSLLGTFHEARQVELVPRRQLLWEVPLVKPVAQFVIWTLPRLSR